jgi:HTH-type transcriptional regulator/antitoxin HigA
MKTSQALYSDLPVPPGEYLLEVLREKGLTQAELARRMGRPLQPVNEIVKGKKAITAETALQMEAALGVPAHIWTGLEAEYRLTLARNARAPARPAAKRKPAARRRA